MTNYKFTGQELDEESGLYYYNARYYDPSLGRFLTADTIVQFPDNAQSYNRYAYTLNNPIRYTDPTGHGIDGPYDHNGSGYKPGSDNSLGLNECNSCEGSNEKKDDYDRDYEEKLRLIEEEKRNSEALSRLLNDLLNYIPLRGVQKLDFVLNFLDGISLGQNGNDEQYVDLYRAVSPAEFKDIMRTGKFRSVPGSLSGKQFGLDFHEVLELANSPILKDTAAIIKTTIPEESFNALDRTPVDPFILRSGSATAQPGWQIDLLNSTLIDIQHVY